MPILLIVTNYSIVFNNTKIRVNAILIDIKFSIFMGNCLQRNKFSSQNEYLCSIKEYLKKNTSHYFHTKLHTSDFFKAVLIFVNYVIF